MQRGEIWWADLPQPFGSEPGIARPVVVIQANPLNQSRMPTVVVVAVTSNLRLRAFPGNVFLSPRGTGLDRPSVVISSQLATLDRRRLLRQIGNLPRAKLDELDEGLRLVLAL